MSRSFTPSASLVRPHVRRRITLLMLATVVALWGSGRTTHSQSGPSYGITDLGTIGGTASVALTLDDLALPEVYGYGTTASGEVHALRAHPGFGASDLGTLPGGHRSEARKTYQYSAVGLSEVNGSTHAVIFDTELVDEVPRDIHDQPVTGVVTPTRTITLAPTRR